MVGFDPPKFYFVSDFISGLSSFTSSGKVTVKVVPTPGADVKVISPCNNFTNRATIANPNPVLPLRMLFS